MIQNNEATSAFQLALKEACAGTDVTTRELLKTLAWDDIARIKEGDITVDDLRSTVLELMDSKEKASVYTIAANTNNSQFSEAL